MYYLIASPNPTYLARFATCVAYTNALVPFCAIGERLSFGSTARRLVVGCQFQGVSARERGVN